MADFRQKLAKKNAGMAKTKTSEMLKNIEDNRLVEDVAEEERTGTDAVNKNIVILHQISDDRPSQSEQSAQMQSIPKNLDEPFLEKSTDTQEEHQPSEPVNAETLAAHEHAVKEVMDMDSKNMLLDSTYRIPLKGNKNSTYVFNSSAFDYSRKRSLQLNMPWMHYINMLIEEEKIRIGDTEYIEPDINIKEAIDKGKKESHILTITEDHWNYLTDGGIVHMMKPSKYLNYIILKEQIREEKEGRRIRVR